MMTSLKETNQFGEDTEKNRYESHQPLLSCSNMPSYHMPYVSILGFLNSQFWEKNGSRSQENGEQVLQISFEN